MPKPLTPCPDDGGIPVPQQCQCSAASTTNECPVPKFCYGDGMVTTCHPAPRPTPCTTDGTTAIAAAPCQCSSSATTNECAVSKYCYGGSCHDAPEPPPVCAAGNTVALAEACTCGAALCASNNYCWVGNACETEAKPLPPTSPSPQSDSAPSVPSPADATADGSGIKPGGNGINQGSKVPSMADDGDASSKDQMNNGNCNV